MTIINPLPYTLTNGTTADATQVMADFNQIVANANSNAAHSGANSDITSLSGLTTPLSVAQGGTGATTFTSGNLISGNGTSALQDSGAPATAVPPTGFLGMWPLKTAPTGWLNCDGSTVSRTTYAALFGVLTKSATVTITIASPAVISWTAHGFAAGDPVSFETTGTLPTGLSVGTTYYVLSSGLTTNAFEVSTTPGGTAVNTSGTQSGTQTGRYVPYGPGDGSTTFGVPDYRGRVPAGYDSGNATSRLTQAQTQGVSAANLGNNGGEQGHTLTSPGELPAHSHGVTDPTHSHTSAWGSVNSTGALPYVSSSSAGTQQNIPTTSASTGISIQSTGSGGAHNNVQPTLIVNFIIKT